MSQDEEGSIKACMTCGHLKPVHKEDGTICFGVVEDSAQCSCRQYIERYVSIFYPELGKPDPLKEIIEERRKVYGDPYLSHQAIGLCWEGIFRNRYHIMGDVGGIPVGTMFPADLVADMLAGFKVVRLARPVYHQDSADDAHNYIKFDEEFRGGKKIE